MLTVYDTETTGLPNFKERSDHPSQPHLVQLAAVAFDDDGTEKNSFDVIIRPDGWTISPEISKIHGITQERALDVGIPEATAVEMYLSLYRPSQLRVAHNESFDRRIMRIAMTRAGIERAVIEELEARPSFCTCQNAKFVVNLPPTDKMLRSNFTGPKPPKLEECIQHFFGESLDGAHNALVDVRACARVYFHLREIGRAL